MNFDYNIIIWFTAGYFARHLLFALFIASKTIPASLLISFKNDIGLLAKHTK
jgi:hypothetical protein